MKRQDLEHIIRAAAAISNQYEIIIVGSQSILGAIPNAPEPLLFSQGADVYPLGNPDLASLIDGTIGEQSRFHEQFGYYAQGVGPETAKLPSGWQQRLHKIQNTNTDLKIGWCLDPADLAASKLIAGREKDFAFVACMLQHHIVQPEVLVERLQTIETEPERIERALGWLKRQEAESQDRDSGSGETPSGG